MRRTILLLALLVCNSVAAKEPLKSRKQLLQEQKPKAVSQLQCINGQCNMRADAIASARIRANPGYGQTYGFKIQKPKEKSQ